MSEIPPRPESLPHGGVPPLRPDLLPVSGVSRPFPASWRWWEATGAFLIGTIFGLVVSIAVAPLFPKGEAQLAGVSIVFDLVILGTLLLWLRFFQVGWQAAIGFPSKMAAEVWKGFVGGLVLMLLANYVVGTVVLILVRDLCKCSVLPPQQLETMDTGISIAMSVLFAVIVAPITEEFFFRGLIFRSIRTRHAFLYAAVVSALAFGAVHFSPQDGYLSSIVLMVPITVVGFGLAFIYERRGNIVAPMAAHMTFNLIGIVLILFRR